MEIKFNYKIADNTTTLLLELGQKKYKSSRLLKFVRLCDLVWLIGYTFLWFCLFFSVWYVNLHIYSDDEAVIYFCYALSGCFFLFFLYALVWRPFLWDKAVYNKVKEIGSGERIIALQEEGVCSKSSEMINIYAYSSISSVEHIARHLVIIINEALFIEIPYMAFTDEQHRKQFEQELDRKINESLNR